MKFDFECTLEDMVEYNLFLQKQKFSAALLFNRLSSTLVCGLLTYFLIEAMAEPVAAIFMAAVSGIAIFASFPSLVRQKLTKTLRKMHEGDSVETQLCRHTLDINDEGITESTEHNRNFTGWSSIDKVILGIRYIYIFIAPQLAHVIPTRTIAGATPSDVFAELERLSPNGLIETLHDVAHT